MEKLKKTNLEIEDFNGESTNVNPKMKMTKMLAKNGDEGFAVTWGKHVLSPCLFRTEVEAKKWARENECATNIMVATIVAREVFAGEMMRHEQKTSEIAGKINEIVHDAKEAACKRDRNIFTKIFK